MSKLTFIDNVCDAVAAHNYPKILELVEGSGGNINVESEKWSSTPLGLAVTANDPLVASYLIFKGASPDFSEAGLSARQMAALANNPQIDDVISERVKFTPRSPTLGLGLA